MKLEVYDFNRKTAFITGGASGIGAAPAEAFAGLLNSKQRRKDLVDDSWRSRYRRN